MPSKTSLVIPIRLGSSLCSTQYPNLDRTSSNEMGPMRMQSYTLVFQGSGAGVQRVNIWCSRDVMNQDQVIVGQGCWRLLSARFSFTHTFIIPSLLMQIMFYRATKPPSSPIISLQAVSALYAITMAQFSLSTKSFSLTNYSVTIQGRFCSLFSPAGSLRSAGHRVSPASYTATKYQHFLLFRHSDIFVGLEFGWVAIHLNSFTFGWQQFFSTQHNGWIVDLFIDHLSQSKLVTVTASSFLLQLPIIIIQSHPKKVSINYSKILFIY